MPSLLVGLHNNNNNNNNNNRVILIHSSCNWSILMAESFANEVRGNIFFLGKISSFGILNACTSVNYSFGYIDTNLKYDNNHLCLQTC